MPVTTDQREERRPAPPPARPAPTRHEPLPPTPLPRDEPGLARTLLALLVVWTMALALLLGRIVRVGASWAAHQRANARAPLAVARAMATTARPAALRTAGQ